MKEFKGTKGKWFMNYINGYWSIQDLESYQEGFRTAIADVYYFNDGKDTAEANALLISKAPEMLEMLIDLRNCKETWSDLFQSDKDRIELLIKQATEL